MKSGIRIVREPARPSLDGMKTAAIEQVWRLLPDGRIVTSGHHGLSLVWDPGRPAATPVELSHAGSADALAVLPDGRVVTRGLRNHVTILDPDRPAAAPPGFGTRKESIVSAMVALPDGRVVTGGDEGRVLIWDPDHPGAAPAELGRHDGLVLAMAVLADGRVVTCGTDERVRITDPFQTQAQGIQLNCRATRLAAAPPGAPGSNLVIAHRFTGFSLWSIKALASAEK